MDSVVGSIAARLAAVRQIMADLGYDALFVPHSDEYLGEYLPPHNERLRWLTGFTGSAGMAVILPERAAIFVDGRYTVQVRSQVDAELFEYHHLIEDPQPEWLAQCLSTWASVDSGVDDRVGKRGGKGIAKRVGCDPRLHSLRWYRHASATLSAAGIELIGNVDNIIDRCWNDRPRVTHNTAMLLDESFTGVSSRSKCVRIAAQLIEQECDAALVFAADSICWLLNIRGTDMLQLPVLPCFALMSAQAEVTLFTDISRLPETFAAHVGEAVTVLPEKQAPAVLGEYSGKKVLADPTTANAWLQLLLEEAGAILVAGDDPVAMPKACKNSVEQAGTRIAHQRDGVAEVRFLAWLDGEVAAGRLHDEAILSDKLLSFRAAGEYFQDTSFDTISAAGPNAAMCHYNHLNAEPAKLVQDSVYLVDSGAQYTDGTTDITRTVAIGKPAEEVRRLFTLVLKGHIALARARFPSGTTGSHLDALARQFLWHEGYDFDHGTGHGVGVFLSVHEGPQRISKVQNAVPLLPGMIVSNEPGYYRDNAFGIRCENLQLVREAVTLEGEAPMLEFETLSLAPFDLRLVQLELLEPTELHWLNSYHARVRTELSPLLDDADRAWLDRATGSV